MIPGEYRRRFYREWTQEGELDTFGIILYETDLQVYFSSSVEKAPLAKRTYELVNKYRRQIERTIKAFPEFSTSLHPLRIKSRYKITEEMISESRRAGVGPMAGVAGALAEYIGRELINSTQELIIENGGDIFFHSKKSRNVLVYAGEDSPFRDKIRIKLHGGDTPCGICTSSGKIGHSLSFGSTDATIVIAESTITADVFATAAGNMVKSETDLEDALGFLKNQTGIRGTIILIGEKIAVWGDVELA
jgi:ApbE superfamily uncharacterized protein (UPF0280 family)